MLAGKPKPCASHFQNMTRLFAALLMLWPMAAGMALADPLPDPPPKVLPDPSPNEAHAFAPSEATAGTADPGRKLGSIAGIRSHDPGCTALSPCAVPPPSLERAETLPPHAPANTDPG
jgi:hypothetical protein